MKFILLIEIIEYSIWIIFYYSKQYIKLVIKLIYYLKVLYNPIREVLSIGKYYQIIVMLV